MKIITRKRNVYQTITGFNILLRLFSRVTWITYIGLDIEPRAVISVIKFSRVIYELILHALAILKLYTLLYLAAKK